MRTTEETAIELYKIAMGWTSISESKIMFNDLPLPTRSQWLRLAEYGMNKHDEAVAHGMTIVANKIRHEIESCGCNGIDRNGCESCNAKENSRVDILTARDNKVWRKE